MMNRCPFVMRVRSDDPILKYLVEKGILRKLKQEELKDIFKPIPREELPIIEVKEPKFNIHIENKILITPDGKEVKMIDYLKSKE